MSYAAYSAGFEAGKAAAKYGMNVPRKDGLNEPNGGNQNQRILKFLQQGGTLTHADARFMFNCDRLAARICNLRDMGYEIDAQMIDIGQNKKVARYSLKKE